MQTWTGFRTMKPSVHAATNRNPGPDDNTDPSEEEEEEAGPFVKMQGSNFCSGILGSTRSGNHRSRRCFGTDAVQ